MLWRMWINLDFQITLVLIHSFPLNKHQRKSDTEFRVRNSNNFANKTKELSQRLQLAIESNRMTSFATIPHADINFMKDQHAQKRICRKRRRLTLTRAGIWEIVPCVYVCECARRQAKQLNAHSWVVMSVYSSSGSPLESNEPSLTPLTSDPQRRPWCRCSPPAATNHFSI